MKKGMKWMVASLVVTGIGTGGFFWWQAGAKAKPAPVGEVVTARKGDLVLWVKATGTVEPEYVVEVKSKASGVVELVPFQEGELIRKGALVVRIDPIVEKRKVTQAEAELRMAQAGLQSARSRRVFSAKQLERDAGLFKKGLVSGESVDVSRKEAAVQASEVGNGVAQVLRARESLSEAKDRLAETEIRSPITGTVLERSVQPGQIVASGTSAVNGGTTLLKIADLSRMFVRVKVDEADVARVAAGQNVKLTADGLPGKTFDAKVLRVAPQGKVESNVTVFEVVAEVGAEGRKLLKPMMSANVEIEANARRGVVLVPLRAVRQSKQAGGKVVTIEGQGVRVVKTGTSDSKEIEIISGVNDGERLFIAAAKVGGAAQKPGAPSSEARNMRKMMGGR